MNVPLSNAVRVAAEMRAKLAEIYGLAEDDEAIDDTISGETDLPELIAAIARKAIQHESFAKAVAGMIKELQDRKARLEHTAERERGVIAWAMSDGGFNKLKLPDMSLTLSPGKPPLIMDEADVPQTVDFCNVKYTPSKTKIRELIEGGTDLPFARIGNAVPVLTIRRA